MGSGASAQVIDTSRFLGDRFLMETRVVSMTCQDGAREVLRFPSGTGSLPATITINRDMGAMVFIGGGSVSVPESGGLIASRGLIGSFGLTRMIYIEDLQSQRAEWMATSMNVGGAFDPSGENDDTGEVDLSIPFGVRDWITFFGRVVLDANGRPTRMKATLTWGFERIDDDPVFAMENSCVYYRKMVSVE